MEELGLSLHNQRILRPDFQKILELAGLLMKRIVRRRNL